jgi:hypothetical protein
MLLCFANAMWHSRWRAIRKKDGQSRYNPRVPGTSVGSLARCVVTAIVVTAAGSALLQPAAQGPVGFGDRITLLSEPGGHFDTDNLISNEASYLEIIPDLSRRKVRGGAYIGVGPDQNFTYIAAIRPSVAFILDIRRDNLLLHLLFKALFDLARTRVDYLALLLGRSIPPDASRAPDARLDRIISVIDRANPADVTTLRASVDARLKRMGVPLSRDDLTTIDRFHRRFIDLGLDLRFQSTGRPPRSYYPTYRELLLAVDRTGQMTNFLASDEAFRFLKELQARDLVIPVVGDISGSKALAAIGRLIAERGERLSAFYVSNVEFYLFFDGRFPRFLANIRRVPHADNTVIIRSAFGQYASGSDKYSSTHLDSVVDLLRRSNDGRIRRYTDLLVH